MASSDFDQTHVFLGQLQLYNSNPRGQSVVGYVVNGGPLVARLWRRAGNPTASMDYTGSVASLYLRHR